jgi:hypothetical protein
MNLAVVSVAVASLTDGEALADGMGCLCLWLSKAWHGYTLDNSGSLRM